MVLGKDFYLVKSGGNYFNSLLNVFVSLLGFHVSSSNSVKNKRQTKHFMCQNASHVYPAKCNSDAP